MKGTLLVLAILVTHELGIKMAETCPIFYGIFGTVVSGSELLMNAALDTVKATEPEKAAFGKIQDCYKENGLTSVLLDSKAMIYITFNKDCL
ncbi:major allergen I polypeptide chain 2-like [Suricata suricatta]|uniref:major allergen I polypeptide chain 2-like n=1 Tax=Suricata suricatta TaxID=37032 RepID=UPI00115543C2|nr:major allergen I polypeptide chain 2-like [Suricata suricatta]